MDNKVLCLGIVVADFLGKPIESMPERGKLVLTDKTELHVGGCAANTAIILKKLGVNVSIAGKVGNDNLGRFITDKLRDEEIDVSLMKTSMDKTTSGTLVFIHSDGERSFIHSIGANGDLRMEDIDFSFVNSFPLLHIAGAFLMPGFDGKPLAETLKKAKESGLVTCLDTAWDSTGRWMELVWDSLPYVDYFLPSIEEARMITGKKTPEDISMDLMKMGVKNVGLKMGKEGSFISNGKERYKFGPIDVQVVDTTGCGDAYAGGFIAGIIKGLTFQQCGILANITGAKIATSIGTTAGVKSYEDTVEFGKKHGFQL